MIFLKSPWQSNVVSADVHWHGSNIVAFSPYTCIDISFCFDTAVPHPWIGARDTRLFRGGESPSGERGQDNILQRDGMPAKKLLRRMTVISMNDCCIVTNMTSMFVKGRKSDKNFMWNLAVFLKKQTKVFSPRPA